MPPCSAFSSLDDAAGTRADGQAGAGGRWGWRPVKGRPQDSLAFDSVEFAQLFELAVRAGESPQESAEGGDLDVELVGDHGEPVRLADSPYNRAGLAIKRRYETDETRFLSALFRFRALMDLISGDALGRWLRSSIRREGANRVHPAVLDVASSMRVSKNGKFAVRKFLRVVEETARSRYTDLSEWPLGAEEET